MAEVFRIHKKDFVGTLSDPVRFIETFMKIDGEPAKLYEYQKKFLRDKNDNRAVEKARQLGFSLICAYEAVVYAFTDAPTTSLFVSITQPQSEELIRHARNAWYSIPEEIEVYDDEGNLQKFVKKEIRFTTQIIEFPNGSRLISLPNSPKAARGYRAHRVYWDEAAAFENEYEMLRAIGVTRVRGGSLTYISTHHGMNTEFYKVTELARKGKGDPNWNGFTIHTVPWWECPDEKYKEFVLVQARQLGGTESPGFVEEFCCKAIDESVAFITKAMLDASIDAYRKTADIVTGKSLEYWRSLAYTGKNPFYLALDVGRIADSTVLIAVEDMGQFAVIRYILELGKEPLPEQTRKLISLLHQTYFTKLWVDAIGLGKQMAEALQEEFGQGKVELVEAQGPEKERLFTDLYATISNLKVLIPPTDTNVYCERLYNQLHSLKREYTEKAHVIRYIGDKGAHDDYSFALALICSALAQPIARAGIGAMGKDDSTFIMQTREGIQTSTSVPVKKEDIGPDWVKEFTSRQYDELAPDEMPCPTPKCVELSKGQKKPIMMKRVQNSTARSKGSEWLCEICWCNRFLVDDHAGEENRT
jgi:phage FluMu gp28-like protein